MEPMVGSHLRMHENFRRLRQLARQSHERGRAAAGIDSDDVTLARMYCYAFRLHVIGAFHATRAELDSLEAEDPLAQLQLRYARELLIDLANRGMDPVSDDQRALISTFHFYCTHVERAAELLMELGNQLPSPIVATIRDRFVEHMEAITSCNGIYLTTDTHAPRQACFVVPNLGITIVPLVYGDHHSWNLAWLDQGRSDVPYHIHHDGVEIHLGYGPLHGYTVLGNCRAEVSEGYAMPIPPETRHGYTNIGTWTHHVPFVFGSCTRSGWGVFLDVEPSPIPLESLESKPLRGPAMNGSVHLEREIDLVAGKRHPVRYPIIPARLTDRGSTGGLELSLARVTPRGTTFRWDHYCAVSVVRGSGTLRIASEQREITRHDHFGIPAGITAEITSAGDQPLVLLDALLKPPQ